MNPITGLIGGVMLAMVLAIAGLTYELKTTLTSEGTAKANQATAEKAAAVNALEVEHQKQLAQIAQTAGIKVQQDLDTIRESYAQLINTKVTNAPLTQFNNSTVPGVLRDAVAGVSARRYPGAAVPGQPTPLGAR